MPTGTFLSGKVESMEIAEMEKIHGHRLQPGYSEKKNLEMVYVASFRDNKEVTTSVSIKQEVESKASLIGAVRNTFTGRCALLQSMARSDSLHDSTV